MSELEHQLLEEMVQWYRLQRHDFFNHWQVVMGNIQLQQPEKAFDYILGVIKPQEEQKIGQIPVPVLSAILLGWIIRLRKLDITTSLSFPDVMRLEDFWQDHWQKEYGESLFGYTRECLDEVQQYNGLPDLNSEVYLFEENQGFSCQFILEDEEKVLFEKMSYFGIQGE
ncbi:Spo0B domain-containing protein [Desulfosporosinus sp. FKA]|uniref:Spo0B domain-containing protein n=1 Tax=Desulfosporosinus sp. FKA TaxID=1969834 RepID=UPI001FA84145|nr:Spo0B domain-containing protein [Desulfosporosinus sp. FKA]